MGLQDCLYLGNLDAFRDWGHARDYVEGMWRSEFDRLCSLEPFRKPEADAFFVSLSASAG